MIRQLAAFFGVSLLLISGMFTAVFPTATFADTYSDHTCNSNHPFLGLPHWYDGVQKSKTDCSISITNVNQVWTIVLNILNLLLSLAGILAVVFIIIGGIRYIISQGESSGISAAKQTIVRAIVGLVLAIGAVVILNFVIAIFGLHSTGDTYKVSSVTESRTA